MKKLGILAGIAVALGLVVLLVPRTEQRLADENQRSLDAAFPEIHEDDVGRIEIDSAGQHVSLAKKENRWVVAGDRDWPADPRGLDSVLRLATTLRADRAVSRTMETHERYEVTDEKGAHLRYLGQGGNELLSLVVGKLGPDMKSCYVRLYGKPEVYVVAEPIRELLDRKPEVWRDRTFVQIDPGQVHELRIAKKGQPPLVLTREAPEPSAWKIAEPAGWGLGPATVQEIENVSRILAVMIATEIPPPAPDKEYGLDDPSGTVQVSEFNGKVTKLLFGKTNEERQIFAKREGADVVYLLQSWMVDKLLASPAALQAQQGSGK